MADLVMVRYKPTGEVRAVDPDKWDVPGQVATGNFEQVGAPSAATSPLNTPANAALLAKAQHPTLGSVVGSMTRMPTSDPGSAGRSAAVLASGAKNILSQSGPEAAAMLATLAVPEARPLGWLLRPLIAGGTAAAADVPAEAMAGRKPTIEHAATRGAMNLGGQSVGELLGGIFGALGKTETLDATGATKAVRKAYPGIDEAILKERIPVGRPGTQSGQKEIAARASTNASDMRSALNASPAIHSPDDILAQVDSEIAQLKQSAHPEDAADAVRLQARRDAFATRNPAGLTSDQLDRAVRSSQQRAKGTYTKDVNGQPVTVQTTPDEQMYHRLLARQGRLELRKVPGVADTKDRAQQLINMDKVYANTEAASPPPLSSLADPLRVGPTILKRTLLRPDNASRMGLALSDPRLLASLRSSPLFLEAVANALSTPAAADATTQGGSR